MSPESQAPKLGLFDGTDYRLVAPLARGSMGHLYLVEHRTTGCQWVAKVVHEALATDPQLVDRVRIEAESLSHLRHPNVVAVIDHGTTADQRPFIVMEHLRGNDLAREIASGRVFTLEEILDLADQALAGIEAAHNLGIIHRDLKPENLFMHEHNGERILKVLDFSVARIVPGVTPQTPSPLAYSTGMGLIVGTPKYLSPEGAAGLRVDYRADLYSMGLVVYEMLAGRGPYGEDLSDSEMIAMRLTHPPKPPSYFAPRPIASQLDEVVLKALQLSANQRHQTAGEFRRALSEVRAAALEFANSNDPVPIALSLKRQSAGASRDLGGAVPVGGAPVVTSTPKQHVLRDLLRQRLVPLFPSGVAAEHVAIAGAALLLVLLVTALMLLVR
jgi:serine/threonine-protein kinase